MDWYYTNINPMDFENWEEDMELEELNWIELEKEREHKKSA